MAEDYNEACAVLDLSPKASAALSRRCLQAVLREKAGVKKGKLDDEIEQAIRGGTMPSHVVECLHSLRKIGNLAAHPEKSERSGEILNVEPGEAEWALDTLEALFDSYYVAPAKNAEKKKALDAKLAAAKGSPTP